MSTLRDRVLAALEQACREEATLYASIMDLVTTDKHASRYGGLTPRITYICGVGVTMDQVRRVLNAEAEAAASSRAGPIAAPSGGGRWGCGKNSHRNASNDETKDHETRRRRGAPLPARGRSARDRRRAGARHASARERRGTPGVDGSDPETRRPAGRALTTTRPGLARSALRQR